MKGNLVLSMSLMVVAMGAFTSVFDQGVNAEPAIVIVPDDYSTIRKAITAVSWGGTVLVREGNYSGPIIIDKSLSLVGIGENRSAVINGSSHHFIVGVDEFNVSVSGFTIMNCREGPVGAGVLVKGTHDSPILNTTISNNTISDNSRGIYLQSCHNITIRNNRIVDNRWDGITLYDSSSNLILDNKIHSNWRGLDIEGDEHTIIGNTISANKEGINLSGSNNTLRNNTLINNRYNLDIDIGLQRKYLINDVDTTNTVENSPIFYLVNQQDIQIPRNAGYVALMNCKNITVKDAVIKNGKILLGSTENSVIQDNIILDCRQAIELHYSNGNKISDNNITNNEGSIALYSSNDNVVEENRIESNYYSGISIISFPNASSNNAILNNYISSNYGAYGIDIGGYNNTVMNNTLVGNRGGISIVRARGKNILRNNNMADNRYNLRISSDLEQDIDTSNTVNGKPVYYLAKQRDLIIDPSSHPNIGYLGIINSYNITIKGIKVTNNGEGIRLANTDCSLIENVSVVGNGYGLSLTHSNKNKVCYSLIEGNGWDNGIRLNNCSENLVQGNRIIHSVRAMFLIDSHENGINGNTIIGARSEFSGEKVSSGLRFSNSNNNSICHNNFIQLLNYVERPEHPLDRSANTWDDGAEGNYWDNYNGTDLNRDGIGDSKHVLYENNTDRYPLVAPINTFDAGTWNGEAYNVDVVSNSTVSAFHFNPDDGAFLRFNVTGDSGTAGFCRVTIPKSLLWAEEGWTITVGDNPITNYMAIPDENYTYVYFIYNHTTKMVLIQGTDVIPEFPQATILPLFVISTLVVFVLRKKKMDETPET